MAFWGNVGSKISNVSNQVAGKTKNTFEQAKLENEIYGLENDIRDKYQELGRMMYEFSRLHTESPDYEPVMARIDKLKSEINEKKEKIETIKSRKVCPVCGATIEAGTRFCPNCGTPIESDSGKDENIESDRVRHVCPKCGAPIEPGDQFCTVCGARLAQETFDDEPIQPEGKPTHPEEERQEKKMASADASLNDASGDMNRRQNTLNDEWTEKETQSDSVMTQSELIGSDEAEDSFIGETSDPAGNSNQQDDNSVKETEADLAGPRMEETSASPETDAADHPESLSGRTVNKDESDDDIRFCPNCGAKIWPGALFCDVCGTRLR